MKKNQTILIALILMLIGGMKAQAQILVLWHPDGTTTDVELYTQPRVQFVDDKVIVASSVINLEYDKNDVIRFTYKGKETGTNAPLNASDYEQKDGQLIFHHIKSASKVSIYRTNGIRVPIQLSLQGNHAILSLASIPSGVYMLSVNGRTSKFTKK